MKQSGEEGKLSAIVEPHGLTGVAPIRTSAEPAEAARLRPDLGQGFGGPPKPERRRQGFDGHPLRIPPRLGSRGFLRKRVKGWVIGLALAIGLFATQHVAIGADDGSATAAIRDTINKVIRILQDEELKQPGRQAERRAMLEQVIGDRFDYEEMSKRSLGSQWRKLGGAERQEFVKLFTALLADSYADKIEGYSGEQVEYVSERRKDNYAEVKTKVFSGKLEIPLDYRLINQSGDWRVYDVVVDGISLVRNYRGQFTKIIKASGYPELVKALQEKAE